MEKTRVQINNEKIAREKATIAVYQNLLVNTTEDEIKENLNNEELFLDDQENKDYCLWLIETTLSHKESYQKLIETHLKKGWTFERLNMIERAILLIATCELLESELSKVIIINEAVINAKKFCDDDSYKFINGILAKII